MKLMIEMSWLPRISKKFGLIKQNLIGQEVPELTLREKRGYREAKVSQCSSIN